MKRILSLLLALVLVLSLAACGAAKAIRKGRAVPAIAAGAALWVWENV